MRKTIQLTGISVFIIIIIIIGVSWLDEGKAEAM
jgi:hypothetical protein